MKLYKNLSKVGFLKKYSTKFLAIAFLGIHIPLIGLIVFLTFYNDVLTPITILVLTLVFTLIATVVTLFILNKLLEPIKLARNSLKDYLQNQKIPDLPIDYKDEVGELLRDLQFSIDFFDNLLESKQQTIAILSHDLRNPCSKIIMSLNLLEITKDEKERQEILETMKIIAKDQLALLDATLQNLRSESKVAGELKKQDLVLNQIIKQVVDSEKINLKNKNLTFIFNNEIDLKFKGNATAFKQVFSNLIGNAIKFSLENGNIIINTQKTETEIKVDIIDEGLGFENAIADELFKPFTEYSKKGSQGEKSNGMGLFISRRFISKHFGTLTAQSGGLNKGAIFSVRLPLQSNH